MLPTSRELLRLSETTGFDSASLERVIRLAEFLAQLQRQPDLSSVMALKGGTALNLFFGAPKRLSVDLDFNYIGATSRADMLAARPAIELGVTKLARSLGYGVQASADAHAGRKIYLGYRRVFDSQSDRLEVDINYLHRISFLPLERRRIWRPDGVGAESTLVSWTEIAAGKLVTLLDRGAARDAWDVARLPILAPDPWPPTLLRPIFIAMAGSLPRPLYDYSEVRLDRIGEAEVSRTLHPMLATSDRPTAAELRSDAGRVLAPLLELTDGEREFSHRLQKGDFTPELLFPSQPELAARVAMSPLLQWKAQNAHAHRRR